jgi:hypothetical protein
MNLAGESILVMFVSCDVLDADPISCDVLVNWKEHFAGPAANVILTTLGYLAPGDAHYEPCLTHPPEPHDSPRFREVLALLDRIKARTSTQPNIYPEFIDMFAAWKLGR